MSLRFFSDHCVPSSISTLLRQQGYEVILLRDVMPPRSIDPDVIAKAQALDCILVTLNGDFSDIVAYPPSTFRGIVSIQLHNHPEIIPQLMERLTSFVRDHPDPEYYRGKLFIAEAHRIRIRE